MTHPIDPPRTRRCRLPRRRTLLAALLFAGLPFAGTLVAAVPAREGAPAPEFHVRSLDGRDLRLASLRHHGPVIVEFWGLKCDSCSAGLTELEGWRKRYGPNGLSIVAFSMDGSRNISLVRPYVMRLHLGYPVVIDDQQRVQHRGHPRRLRARRHGVRRAHRGPAAGGRRRRTLKRRHGPGAMRPPGKFASPPGFPDGLGDWIAGREG